MQQVDEATHIHGHTLDLVFTNPMEISPHTCVDDERIVTQNQFVKFDHFPVFFQFSSSVNRSIHCSTTKQIIWRNTKNIDFDNLQNTLLNKLDVSFHTTTDSFAEKLSVYNSCLKDTINDVAPFQSKTVTCTVDDPD